MKRNKLIYAAGLGLLVSLGACKKELDQFPADAIETGQSFVAVKDAKAWDNGLYASLRSNLYGTYMYSQDVQADQLNATADYGNRNGNPHRWGQSFLADDGAITTAWSSYYSAINNANIAIKGYDNIVTTTTAEKAELDRYRGDAYLMRAYYYHELMKRFAKPYSPATAATDLGVPLVLVYDLNAKPARATVKAVYDQIILDLVQAKTLLAAVPGAQGSTRFTVHAVSALEARVKLHMQDFIGAITAAESVITPNVYPLITTAVELNSMWKNDFGKEVIFQSAVSAPNELPNTNNIYLGLVAATGKFTPDFVPSQWVIDAYDATDLRKNVYFEQKTLTIQGATYNNIWLVNKYPGNPALFTGATTNYAHAPRLFRVAEMYLISAEAGARAGAATEPAALGRLNNLRTARGLLPIVAAGPALFQAVKDERFRELAFEGFRLWDLKRWNEGFMRRLPQNSSLIITGANFDQLNIAASDPKFVWGLPTRDLTTNPSLVQNTGW